MIVTRDSSIDIYGDLAPTGPRFVWRTRFIIDGQEVTAEEARAAAKAVKEGRLPFDTYTGQQVSIPIRRDRKAR